MQGKVHLYTGEGKGKTTAAVGLALRASGRGLHVAIWQFLKPAGGSGEELAVRSLPRIKWRTVGRTGFITDDQPTEEDRVLVSTAWQEVLQDLSGVEFQMVVLDEITQVCNLGLINPEEVVRGIKNRAPIVEVIMTGRDAAKQLMDITDYQTEMECVRHPFARGLKARRGIEF